MQFNPEHKTIECRGWNGANYQSIATATPMMCTGSTKAGSGLCHFCRDRISSLVEDLKLAKEWEEEKYE